MLPTPCLTWFCRDSHQQAHTLWTGQKGPSLLLCTEPGLCASTASRQARFRLQSRDQRGWSCLVTWAVRCCPHTIHPTFTCGIYRTPTSLVLSHTTYTCAFKTGCLMSHNWLHTPDCKLSWNNGTFGRVLVFDGRNQLEDVGGLV